MTTPNVTTPLTTQVSANEFSDDVAGQHRTRQAKHPTRTKTKLISRVARSVAENTPNTEGMTATRQPVSSTDNDSDQQQQLLQTLNKAKLRNFFTKFVRKTTSSNNTDIRSLINKYVESRSDNDAPLIQALASELGFYGGEPGEEMDPAFKASLKALLINSLLDNNTEQPSNRFDFNGYTFKQLAKEANPLSLTQAKAAFTNQLDANYSTEAKNWLANNILADKDPTLSLNSPPDDIAYGGFAWAELYAGIVTAKSMGLDPNQMSRAELTTLVRTASEVAVANPNNGLPPQALATLLYADAQGAIDLAQLNDNNAETLINRAYQFLEEKVNTAKKIQQAIDTLSSPPPTRSDIAKQILREHGYNPEQVFTWQTHGKLTSQEHSATMYELYMDRESFRGAILTNFNVNFYSLPNVDDKFNQAFASYQQKVTTAYKSLLETQVNALDPEAKQFWENGSHTLLRPIVAIKPGTGTRWETSSSGGGYSGASSGRRVSYTTDQWENWDRGTAKTGVIIEANLNGSKRFFTATWGNDVNFQALPAHIDQPGELEQWVLNNRDKLFTGKDLEQANRAVHTSSTSSRVLAINVQRTISRPEPATQEAIAAMAGEYTNEFKDAAYQQTARQQSMEMLLDMLVPFYGFAQAIKKGNVGEAIISGFADFLSLIPVAGAAAKLGGTAVKTGFKIANIAARQALKTGLQSGTKAALQTAIKTTLQSSAKLAPNLAKGSGQLVLETIDFFNPLGGIDQLGKGLFTFSENAVKQITNKLRSVNSSLANKLDSLTEFGQAFTKSRGTWSVSDASKISKDSNGQRVYTSHSGESFQLLEWNGVNNVPFKDITRSDGSQALVAVNPNTGKAYGPTWKKGPALTTARHADTFNHKLVSREQVGDGFFIYSNKGPDGQPSHAKRLIITAHGAYIPRPEFGKSRAGGFIEVPENNQLKFYGPHKQALEDPKIPFVAEKAVQVHETLQAGEKVRNYRLWNYEPDTEADISDYLRYGNDQQLRPVDERYDVLTIRPDTLKGKTTGYTLNDLLKALKESGYEYDEIHCVFCRWRPGGGTYTAPIRVDGDITPTGQSKGPLDWLLGKSSTSTSPSRLAEQFADNTEQFAETQLINNMRIMDPGLRGTYKLTNPANPLEGRIVPFRFTDNGNNSIKLQAVPEEIATPQDIRAYHLPYNGDQSKGIPYVDIPKTDPETDQLFTGGLNGCSVIVAEHPANSNLFRVYHDAHPTKNIGAKPYSNSRIYGRVDYEDYQRTASQGEFAINAAAFMKFNRAENKWDLYYQPQVLKAGHGGFDPESFSDSLQKVSINT